MRALDAFLPQYEFSERHRVAVAAAPELVDTAIREVALADVPVARALFVLRGLGDCGGRRPLVEQAVGRGGVVLEDVRGEGLVLGLKGDFWRLRRYGGGDSCRAVIDFRVEDGALSTETRVHVADPAARRKFARYWRLIRPFSGLIRIGFLRAARRRAEAGVAA